MMGAAPAIGIDLGTTCSRAAVFVNGSLIRFHGYETCLSTANCVAFTDTGPLIGDEAKNQVVLNPENTIFDSKRMLGRKFDDPTIQRNDWQFEVVDRNGMPRVCAQTQEAHYTETPEEICAMVLADLKQSVQSHLQETVTEAVISVPACFDQSQRQATLNAARIAGLKVIRVISEPAAAVMGYKVEKKLAEGMNVLVFDFGGGKLDVSVIRIDDHGGVEVKSTAGDSRLGGVDFDSLLVKNFLEVFQWKHGRDLRECPKALRRLRIECEHAKRTLSTCTEVEIHLNHLLDGISFRHKLTRAQFESTCMDMFRSTLKSVKRALFDAGMTKGSIDRVVLFGGSTQIPKIKELLKGFFDRKDLPLVNFFYPDEAVAYGAAVQAARMTGRAGEAIASSPPLVDLYPFSLLIENTEGAMATAIHRNSPLPCDGTVKSLVDDSSRVEVFEGEHAMAAENRLLGRFYIEGLPEGEREVNVGLQLDLDGILDVSADESVSVVADNCGLSDHQIDMMTRKVAFGVEMRDAARFKDDARKTLVSYAYSVKMMVEYSTDYALPEGDRDKALIICDTFLDWMNDYPDEETYDIFEGIEAAKEELAVYVRKMDRIRKRRW